MTSIEVVQGDITQLAVDAVVNAANPTLLGGGGVDGAIHRAAGPQLLVACRKLSDNNGVRCPTGEARITPAYNLPARFVIHTVGPIWGKADGKEAILLASCYCNSLDIANQQELETIAFPGISCGIYGYPLDQAAQVSVGAIQRSMKPGWSLKKILLCAFDEALFDAWKEALKSSKHI
ncbi:MAG: O-acetyl-ADP-ribose deacetylase [bacterium]|nr:O-acetyl-ADP-ribose deacetylase [bacterium]